MISIQTNVNSLVAQQNLSVNTSFQSKTIQQLTSGYRINQAGDDAAGLAVANKFRSTVAELTQGVANGNDATAQLQVMDGGMSNIGQILDRLKTLATQSASGAFTGVRATLNEEFQNDIKEIDRQAQSIGLDTGGTFAKNLNVFLGQGSGSANLANGVISVDLTNATVDSRSLGMNVNGMQVVNGATLTTTGQVATLKTDIGNGSTSSVVAILAGGNNAAVALHAAFQFSGAGFSDDGKMSISVDLARVTDVATLVTNVNKAIQTAEQGVSPAAAAFTKANIVASVFTDSKGAQAIAFSSGSSAFQVQAGDQMGNALLGNVTSLGVGTAVVGTVDTATVTAGTVVKTAANFSQDVKLVITGGGLASPTTLTFASGTGLAGALGAITAAFLANSSNAELEKAGLSVTGAAVDSKLTFNSKTGQTFNVSVTGDTANLLGLGSYLTDKTAANTLNNADYNTITAGTTYDGTLAAATGSATFQISLNGGVGTTLSAIDLSTGAGATAASVLGTALSLTTGFTGTDTLTFGSVSGSTHTFTGGATTTVTLSSTIAATSAQVTSTLGSAGLAVGIAGINAGFATSGFSISVNGGTTTAITLLAADGASNAALLTKLNSQLGALGAHAMIDVTAGLKIVSNTVGKAGSTIAITSVGVLAGANLGIVDNTVAGAAIGADATATVGDLAGQIQTQLGANAVVTVVSGQIQVATANKGVGETFALTTTAGLGAHLGFGASFVSKTGTSDTIGDIVDNLNAQFNSSANSTLQAAGLQAVATKADGSNGSTAENTFLTIKSSNGTQFRLASGTANPVGFTSTTAAATNATVQSSLLTSIATLDAYGVSQSKALSFNAMTYGNDSQALTFSAKDATGALQTQTITLANSTAAGSNRAGVSVDDSVAYINKQLQSGTNSALKNIVAVKEVYTDPNTSVKSEGINFVSSLASFTVGVAASANADGINKGAASSISSEEKGSGSNFSIDTQEGAQAAITALAAAVGKLGTAQAAIGRGENQLTFAISLATSQITNFSAAESAIRDTNVAQQAANLSKAQVLSQAAIAAMAQANSAPQGVLSLLRG